MVVVVDVPIENYANSFHFIVNVKMFCNTNIVTVELQSDLLSVVCLYTCSAIPLPIPHTTPPCLYTCSGSLSCLRWLFNTILRIILKVINNDH